MSDDEVRRDLKEVRDGINQLHLELVEVRSQTDRVEKIEKCLERIQYALNGNGVPGMKTRLDRLEQFQRTSAKVLWACVAAVVTLAVKAIATVFA